MLYLYLDESGDLGFDFVSKQPSNFFVITVLAIESEMHNSIMLNSVRKTIARKLNRKVRQTKYKIELKGTYTTISTKRYFYRLIHNLKFNLYSVTLDKMSAYLTLVKDKKSGYDNIAQKVLERIPMNNYKRVTITVDKSKNKPEILKFNNHILNRLQSIVDPATLISINHSQSHENSGLQAADLFCWGIFRRYERSDVEWYNDFKDKIKHELVYP